MMNCHYISSQLERIQQARVGAGERLSIGGSSGLEEQLRTIEVAISRIRDEMWRREGPCRFMNVPEWRARALARARQPPGHPLSVPQTQNG